MADQMVQLPTDSTGKKVDTEELTVGANIVQRQRTQIAGAGPTEIARVKASAPIGTDNGLVVRNLPRREGAVLTAVALGISGAFTQAWQDGNTDGTIYVEAAARADQPSAASGFVIQETDDDTDVNFTRTVASKSVAVNTTTYLHAAIRGRKWRVQYTNGATAQLSFKITAAASGHAAAEVDVDGRPLTAGDVAHNGIDSGNPLKVGGRASDIAPTAVTADGNRVNAWYTRRGEAIVQQRAEVSAANSSTAALALSGVFTGVSESGLGYSTLNVAVFASHASAANGLSIEQSQDGVNWDTKDVFDVPAGEQLALQVRLVADNFRVVFTNGATAQTAFRLRTTKDPDPVSVPDGMRHNHSRFAVATLTLITDAAILAAPGVDLNLYIRSVTVTNTSAVLTRVDLKDGTVIRWQGAAAASGGGFNSPWQTALRLARNAALNGALSAAATDVRVAVEYAVGT